jgi:hypothetical protein
MAKIKTPALTDAALDWAVTKCEGFDPETLNTKTGVVYSLRYGVYTPSTDWAQGGPIIEREKIDHNHENGYVVALMREPHGHDWTQAEGPTPLIAAMRCYVASKLGDEVDVPEELL